MEISWKFPLMNCLRLLSNGMRRGAIDWAKFPIVILFTWSRGTNLDASEVVQLVSSRVEDQDLLDGSIIFVCYY